MSTHGVRLVFTVLHRSRVGVNNDDVMNVGIDVPFDDPLSGRFIMHIQRQCHISRHKDVILVKKTCLF